MDLREPMNTTVNNEPLTLLTVNTVNTVNT